MLIANVLGKEADAIFNMQTAELNTAMAWYGALTYTFQIYFDFSGYSDMAIGIGKMMGFTFPENFKNPYISQSITEFWRRWHITLGTWMRDYLYIPLGGNRDGKARTFFNLWIVFLISGLWHGASWTFIFWGAYHGLFLVLERTLLKPFYKILPGIFKLLITFLIVVVGWVFFRADDFAFAFSFIRQMFRFSGFELELTQEVVFISIFAVAFSFMALIPNVEAKQDRVFNRLLNSKQSFVYLIVSLILYISAVGSITASDFNPFIYFRF